MDNNKKHDINKRILSDEHKKYESNDDAGTINVKISSKKQLFSAYSYWDDKLNAEFSEYIFDKAKSLPIKEEIKIKIYTDDKIDACEVEQALKSHYHGEYKETKKEIKRLAIISTIMIVFGILTINALILLNHFTSNLYITTIVEIASWVFIWEAVDAFFLQRPVIKGKCKLIERIYMAKIEICKDNDKT